MMAALHLGTTSFASAQTEDLQNEYSAAYRKHRSVVRQLADKCRELKKPELAVASLRWVPIRDPSREYLFPLPKNSNVTYPTPEDNTDRYWRSHINKLNRQYAEQLLRLAVKSNEAKQFEFAFRLLHECLFHDPQNSAAQKILGESATELNIRTSSYKRADRLLPDGEISKYETDHFVLLTSLDKAQAHKAIAQFEKWHVVWRQLFYSYWAQSSWLSRRFESGAKPVRKTKKFKVVLYPNRDQYLAKLRPISPGIEVSVGYYLFSEKTSFFYIGDDSNETTWIHELTHQFMHESIPVSSKSRIKSSIWAIEGIAIYMESLVDFSTHLTVGGEDAERLNYCRHNFFRRGFSVPMQTLNALSQTEFVSHPEVTGLYSLAGANCHFAMRDKQHRKLFLKFLQMVHQGKNSQVFFDRLQNQISFDQGFAEFLKPIKSKIEASLLTPKKYKILYLGNSDVDDRTLELLGSATNLESLDLSASGVTCRGIEQLKHLKKLKYLSLERSQISDQCLPTLGLLTQLEELDLTTTAVTDAGLAELKKLSNLVALWIGGTRISDQSLPLLSSLPRLKQLDIRKTRISQQGTAKLAQKVKLTQ